MNHFQKERKALYEIASIFTEFNWIFKEQQTVDLGIDALVETPIDESKKIKLFALQIKGGDKNFYKKSSCLVFYFHDRHYEYWKAYSETCPVLIVLQDSKGNIYWEIFSEDKVIQTNKHWKIDIPLTNILKNSKDKLLSLNTKAVYRDKDTSSNYISFKTFIRKESGELHLRVSTTNHNNELNLKYKPSPKNWDIANSSLNWDDPYYYTIETLKKNISEQCKLKGDKFEIKKSVEKILQYIESGIEFLMEYYFNENNRNLGIASYCDFVKAFELYSGLSKNEFVSEAIDHIVLFHTKDKTFKIDTYPGLHATLKDYFKRDSYDEIYTQTERDIWSMIYEDPGIDKHEFIPILQRKWEYYWQEVYIRIQQEIGFTKHLDKLKERSYRELNGFINLYNETTDIIKLAYNYDETILYPLTVMTMLDIYDEDTCLEEYCEHEFFASNEWESLSLDEESWTSEVFFIKEYEI